MLKAENISFTAGGKHILEEVSLHFEPGLFHVIMGANGAGKSTLLKILAGEAMSPTGKICWNEQPFISAAKKELAKTRAVLSQHYHLTFPVSVNDIVMMGRYPFFDSRPSKKDLDICRKAMELMQVSSLADRDYQTLSGGEAQKVQMSRVLAQIWDEDGKQKKLLFLDEPVSHLDIRFQYQLLRIAKELCTRGVTVIAILHDLNLAMSFADRMIFLKNGKLVFDIRSLEQLTSEVIKEVFDVDATIIHLPNHKP